MRLLKANGLSSVIVSALIDHQLEPVLIGLHAAFTHPFNSKFIINVFAFHIVTVEDADMQSSEF